MVMGSAKEADMSFRFFDNNKVAALKLAGFTGLTAVGGWRADRSCCGFCHNNWCDTCGSCNCGPAPLHTVFFPPVGVSASAHKRAVKAALAKWLPVVTEVQRRLDAFDKDGFCPDPADVMAHVMADMKVA